MSLDFTALENIRKKAKEDKQMQLLDNMIVEEPKDDIIGGSSYLSKPINNAINEDITSKDKEAAAITQKKVTDNKRFKTSINRQQQILEDAKHTTARYQKAIEQTSQLQTEILKDIKKGVSCYDLFLKAIKAVSLAAGNEVFYNQAKNDLIAIYGEGLTEQRPLEIKLEEVKNRLDKLQKSATGLNIDAEDIKRLNSAIKAHKEEIERIESKLRG